MFSISDVGVKIFVSDFVFFLFNPFTLAKLYGWKSALEIEFKNTEYVFTFYTPIFGMDYYK